jgi:hypothetical protein
MQARIQKALLELMYAPDPRTLGNLKVGQIQGVYAYEINDACRLLYMPDFNSNTIWLDRVCSHNMSYSKRH